jgi:Xaa-Pro aminopeptidase
LLFERSEYERRWAGVQRECVERDLAGIVVVSRGGAQTDSYADVLYLSNHYNVFTLLPDAAPHWSGHSHSALVLGREGEPTLVEGFGEVREDLVAVEDVRVAPDLPAGVVAVMKEKGMGGERVGLAGGNAMLVAPYRRLCELTAPGELVPADDAIERLRVRKVPAELDRIRASAEAGQQVMVEILRRAARGGCTEADAVAEGYRAAARAGVAMYDAAVASGPFSFRYTHGRLPSWSQRRLEPGDLFHVDCYGSLDGYLFDFSRTTVVGRSPTAAQRALIDGAAEAVDAGIAALAPGRSGADLFELVRGGLVARGLAEEAGAPDAAPDAAPDEGFAGYECHGHGYGLAWEWPWITPWDTREVESRMAMSVECMAGAEGVGHVKFEQSAIVGDLGPEALLTLPAVCTLETL